MPDPISNDYVSLPTLTPAQERVAVRSSLRLLNRKDVRGAEAWELLDMLGLRDTAAELFAERGRQVPTVPPERGVAGLVGELVSPKKPVAAAGSPASTPRLCTKGLHDMVVFGKRRTDNARWFCGACAAATQKRNRDSRKKAKVGGETFVRPESAGLAPGERWCACDPPHVLTPETSATTYVTPSTGRRRCRVARRRSHAARRRAA